MKRLLISLILVTFACRLEAQVITNGTAVGFPENGVFSGSSIESVQVNNGNLHVEIPLWSFPGRGVSTHASYVYDTKGWYPYSTCTQNDCTYQILPEPGNTMQMALDTTGFKISSSPILRQICDVSPPFYNLVSNTIIRDTNGTKHHMVPDPINRTGVTNNCWQTGGSYQYSDDGSGWYYSGPGAYASKTGGVPNGFDTNGNRIGTTDTLGRTFDTGGGYYDSQGNAHPPTVTVETVTLSTHLCTNLPGTCSEYTSQYYGTWNVPHIITLPDGLKYTIEYVQNDEGEISSITLPTGAQIQYTYTSQPVGSDNSGLRVASRSVTVGSTTSTWYYTYTVTAPGVVVTKVTDPLGNYVNYTCTGMAEQSYSNNLSGSPSLADPSCEITKEQYYNNQGTLIKTVDKTYQDPPRLLASETTTWNQTSQVSQVQYSYESMTINMFPEGDWGPVSAPISWGNITEKREYDWGNGASGSLIRRTDYTYLHTDTSVNPNSNRSLYLAANIADRPTSEIVYDGSSHMISKKFYYYDGGSLTSTSSQPATGHDYTNFSSSNPIRGNLTQLSVWDNTTSSWLNTTYTYDDLGNRRTVTDPGGHTTSYDYTDSFSGASCNTTGSPTYAFATTVTDPSPYSFQKKYKYYQCTSLLQSIRDQNDIDNSRAGTVGTYDLMNRLVTTAFPDGGSSTLSYGGNSGNGYQDPLPLTITKTSAIDGSRNYSNVTVTDGLGRTIQTQALNPEGVIFVDATYDLLSRVYSVSNPRFSTASSTDGTNYYTYDLFGRTLTVTHPDSTVLTTEYDGTATMTTDEGNGNGTHKVQRVLDYDGLSRLKSVCEVSGSTLQGNSGNVASPCGQTKPMTGFLTTYQYSTNSSGYSYITALQTGLTNRVFTYDTVGRLDSSFNPEAGLTSYGYNSDSLVTTRTRPRANQTGGTTTTTSYAYDQLHRLLSETYSDGTTPSNYYCYDDTTAWGYTILNPKGRKTRALVGRTCSAGSGAYTAGEVFSYDAMGRAKINDQCTPGTCGVSAANPVSYTYDYLGNQLTATNGVGTTFSYTTDAAGRLNGATSSLSDPNHPGTLISNVAYGPFGFASANLGSSLTEAIQYQNRGWTQSIADQLGASQPGTGSVSISGTEQSKQGQGQPATSSTASVTISGSGQQKKVYSSDCSCFIWVTNTGHVSVIINGFTGVGYFESSTTTASDVANSLASSFNTNGSSPVTATVSVATVTFTSKATGSSTNYSLSTSTTIDDTQDFSSSPFTFSYVSGSTMTGGHDATSGTIYDAGTATITVNGHATSASWGQGDTSNTIASALSAAINSDGAAYVTATASANVVLLTAKTVGAGSDYSLSATTATTQQGQFQSVSFSASASGGTLSGGANNGQTVYAATVGHAPNGDVTSSTDTVNGNWGYTYDEFNRLTAAANSANSLTWDYDRFGNRWHQTVLAGSATQVSNAFGNNNQSGSYAYDAAGNIMNDGINKYTYDAEDRISCVVSVLGGGSCTTTTGTHYAYDTDGLRVAKYNGSVLTNQYLYNLHGGMISELDGSGNWVRGEIYAGATYIGTYDAGTTTFGLGDWLGTIRYRAKLDGSAAETCTNLPFGDGLQCTDGQSGPSNKHFTGKLHDWETGLDYFGARYYASIQGRFLTPDWSVTPEAVPYGHFENPQSLNLYAYVGNNPITDIDPDGHDGGGPDTQISADQIHDLKSPNAPAPDGGTQTTTNIQKPPPAPAPSTTIDKNKLATYMDAHAHKKSLHLCSRYCSNGLDNSGAAGRRTHTGHARNMGAILMGLGAVPLTTPHKLYTPKKSDFVVFDGNFAHPDGHVATFDGKNWVSDFKQREMSPYKTDVPNFTIYRFPDQ